MASHRNTLAEIHDEIEQLAFEVFVEMRRRIRILVQQALPRVGVETQEEAHVGTHSAMEAGLQAAWSPDPSPQAVVTAIEISIFENVSLLREDHDIGEAFVQRASTQSE